MSKLSRVESNEKEESLRLEDIYKFMDLYFDRYGVMYSHNYNSFNKFIEEDIKTYLEKGEHVFNEVITTDKKIKYKFKYEEVSFRNPVLENDTEPMFPSDARIRKLTYKGRLFAKVTQIQEIVDIGSGERTVNVIGYAEENVPIADIPVMLHSKFCSLSTHKGYDKRECEYDFGGYFIVSGSEKVVIPQDRMCDNKPLVFTKIDSGMKIYKVQVNSRSFRPHGITQVIEIRMKKDGIMTIRAPILSEIPVFILIRALGIETDEEIINYITYNDKDLDMINLIRLSLDNCRNNEGLKIQSQQEAIEYLVNKMKVIKNVNFNEQDRQVKNLQKRLYLEELLRNNLLPHMESNDTKGKAIYFCYMMNKLLNCFLGRTEIDDRDSYVNKRIDLVGDLLMELFKQHYRKMMNECNKFFKRRNLNNHTKPLVIINQIKPNIIEQGIKGSLSTGTWIRKKGVAQLLQRTSYLLFICSLRRIDAQSGDASTSKLTGPRNLHASSISFLCCVSGDTDILMADGTTKQIKDVKNGDYVISVDRNTLKEVITPIKNYFSKEVDKIYEIETITGRTIKCSGDHPLLVRKEGKYNMINAEDIKVNDEVIIRHTLKYINDINYEYLLNVPNIDRKYERELTLLNFIGKPISQEKLKILARLIGLNLTDGHLGIRNNSENQYYCEFFVGEIEDAYKVYDDIQKLGFESPIITRNISKHIDKDTHKETIHSTWKIQKDGCFSYLMKLMGTISGNKTLANKKVPEWILNSNKIIKREFLSAFQGGDGCKFRMQHNNETWKLSMNPTFQTCLIENKDNLIEYLNKIREMLLEFNIESTIRERSTPTKGKLSIGIYITNTYSNLAKYIDYIGYTYCNQKNRLSSSVYEFIKYKNYFQQSKQNKYNKIVELYTMGKKPKEIHNETNIEYKFIKRVIENHNKGKNIVARDYNSDGETINYMDFVKKYYIEDNKLAVPVRNIKILNPETVYDFETVADTHTLIANSFVTSNCASTPEHAKVGLTKHLTIISSITIQQNNQIGILRDFLRNKTINIRDVSGIRIKNMTKVFLNGEWIGLSNDEISLENELKNNKLNGIFEPTTSIIHDYTKKEIRVYCDGGRLYRPVIRVEDNKVKLTKDMIENTSINKSNKRDKITSWDEFMLKNPGIIEYIDMEEQPYLMIADKPETVEKMRETMIDSIDKVKEVENNLIDNRYDDSMLYVKYSHCEFHPSLLLAEIMIGIKFTNHNPGSRAIFAYSQARQAMGTYISNWRDRLDISYILYHPQKSLISTRASKYIYGDVLPAGENVVVAIMCYTGYNQEDSLIFSKSAIDRGLFRSTNLKKYVKEIQKNQSTSQDDIFMKPDANKVIGMKPGSYDKLNEKGFVPEETKIKNGDVIIGMVTPIQTSEETGKPYKDSSEVYKSHVDGVVDKVYDNILNNDGYGMIAMRVRSERTPNIGDKFACYDENTDVLTTKGWKSIKDITTTDFVATLQNGDTLEYKNPTEIQSYDYEGNMYYIKSNQVDLFVTPNHRMYVGNRNGEKYQIFEARDIYGKRKTYMKNVQKINTKGLNEFVIKGFDGEDDLTLPINEWLYFFGMWIAEGFISKQYNCVYFSTNKERIKDKLFEICQKMEFKIKVKKSYDEEKKTHIWYIRNKTLTNYFESLNVKAINKYLPDWVWELNREQCKILIEGMVLGDGHTMANGTQRYDTSSTKLADDFQRLCLHAGWSCNKALKCEAGYTATKKNGEVIKTNVDAWRLTIIKSQNNPLVNKNITSDGRNQLDSYVPFNGKVYCCSVPGEGIIYVRRNGVVVWAGQSNHGQKGTCGIKLKQSDMPFTSEGIMPDICLNPNAIPSRMSIGQLIESLLGKVGVLKGVEFDGTPFNNIDVDDIKDQLEKLGKNKDGNEYLYNGMTGQKIKSMIFIGPTFYQRLKHQVDDKLHVRARGVKMLLTRQAPEGRSRDGALRLGEHFAYVRPKVLQV